MYGQNFIRKNVREILKNENEKTELIKAFINLKENGKYDKYVIWHAQTMGTMVMIDGESTRRNAAHWGPIFLPWHREFLRQFELDLGVALPYWDWTEDAMDPMASPIWSDDFMGGNGDPNNDYIVTKGYFGSEQSKWPTIEANNYGNPVENSELEANPSIPLSDYTKGNLVRFFTLCFLDPDCAGTGGVNPGLPKSTDISNTLATSPYDSSPWDDSSPQNQSFRMRLEARPHGGIHIWVGGHMLTNTSPNDPVFFLHHSNIDRIWAEWQDDITRRNEPFSWYPPQGTITFPDGSIIQGHNRNDHMKPWGTNGNTIENVLDYRSLKYKYE